MSWSFSFELLPGEEIIEDSTKRDTDVIKSAYSIFLTNKRVICRFDGMGSYLSNAFFYEDVIDARTTRRLFVPYLILKTRRKEQLFNIPEPEYWARKIVETREQFGAAPADMPAAGMPPEKKKKMLLDMLTVLLRNKVLTEDEFGEKVDVVERLG